MKILVSLRGFLHYLLGKRSELARMGKSDALMAKVVLDIHRKRTEKARVRVPLYSLHPIHPLDRESALSSLKKRTATVREHAEELRQARDITFELLAKYLPSVSWIKAVRVSGQEGEERYLTFEGNGRLGALHAVFTPEDGIRVEVEEYRFKNPAKIVRRLERVRRWNGLSSS